MRFVRSCRALLMSFGAIATLAVIAHPAAAGIEEAVKAMQAGDVTTAEKELQVLVKERDPRAQFLVGLFIYGNPESKLYDPNKATPLLLDAAERGYLPAMMPLAGAYAEGKGVPKSGSLLVGSRTGLRADGMPKPCARSELAPRVTKLPGSSWPTVGLPST